MREIRKNIYTILVVGFVVFSLTPTFYELYHAKEVQPERKFELVHNFYTDYNFYLSRIRQGLEKNRTVTEKYTSEPHEGSLIQIFYLWLGRVGASVRVPWERPGDVYHVARVVMALLVLALIGKFCQKAFPQRWALIAFLLAVTASTWPKWQNWPVGSPITLISGWRFGGYMSWFSVMDSLQRITFIPHVLAGQALIVFLVMALSDREILAKPGNWIFLGILALLLGLVFPPGLLLVGVACGYLILLELREVGSKKWWKESVLPRLSVGVISAPSLLYLALMVTIYPWKRLVEFDVLNPVAFKLSEYLLAMGPVLPLGLAGLVLALRKKSVALRPAVAWALAFLTLFIGFHFVPQQHPLRYSEVLPHVPLAILTAYLFYTLAGWRGYSNWSNWSNWTNWVKLVPITIILLGLGVMYSSYLWQRDFVDHKLHSSWPLVPSGSYVMYPLKNFIDGMTFLRGNTPRTSVVLSRETTGNYLPVYAGNTAYFGHANTVKYEEKKWLVQGFFAGQMNAEQALQWLKEAGIAYIFFGPQEQEAGSTARLEKLYPFLSAVYENPQVVIFKVP